MVLQTIWFILIAVLLAGYVVLDGFDLGVGIWYLLGGKKDRLAMLQAIGPVWDGNEVWLITGGGALFAAFPHVYATVFSGFYLALMLVVFALIFRGVAVEFRNKVDSPRWHGGWDAAFAGGSALTALLLGVALGNILRGLPLDDGHNFTGSFLSLLNPYALLIGAAGFCVIATQGALFLATKTRGQTREKALRWARLAVGVEAAVVPLAAVATAVLDNRLLRNYNTAPLLWGAPAVAAAALGGLVVATRRGRAGLALLLSSTTCVLLWLLAGLALFPDLVPAANDAAMSLTVTNASSSQRTLTIMLIFALAGMPVVIGYQAWLYWTFRRPADGGSDATTY